MAYVFKDDKSKSPLVYIEYTFDGVPANSAVNDAISEADALTDYGIADLSEYTVLGVMQTYAGNWNKTTAQYVVSDKVYPRVLLNNTSGIQIEAYNPNSATADVTVEIAMLKVK